MALDLLDPSCHFDFVGRNIVRPFCFSGDVPASKPGIVFSVWITRSRFSGYDPGSVRPLFWVSKVCFVVLEFSQYCISLTVELFPHSFPSPSPFPSPAPYADHSKMLTYRSILVVEASGRRFWIRGCFR